MRMRNRMLQMRLTKRQSYLAGPERGATQSEGKAVANRTTSVKVVDRDTIVEVLSQLRDLVESYLEEVNDRAVTSPSEAEPELPYEDAPWPDDE